MSPVDFAVGRIPLKLGIPPDFFVDEGWFIEGKPQVGVL